MITRADFLELARRLRYPTLLVAVAIGYLGAAKLGLLAAVAQKVVSSAWPPRASPSPPCCYWACATGPALPWAHSCSIGPPACRAPEPPESRSGTPSRRSAPSGCCDGWPTSDRRSTGSVT